MSSVQNPYQASQWGEIAQYAQADERANFIKKTYLHLFAAIMAFSGLLALYLNTSIAERFLQTVMGNGNTGLIITFVMFMGASWLARYWASNATSLAMQYLGLSLYVVAQSVIFIPIMYYAANFGGPNIIPTAGLITMIMFTGLTVTVFATGKDFSFLRTGLMIAGFAGLGLIVASLIFGFSLGILFTVFVIALACGYILYDTSNVLHHYGVGQYVGASLELFASVALLFMYILDLLMRLQSRD